MRVLFFSIYATEDCHFAAEIELIEEHLRAGDDVHVVRCAQVLPSCMWNNAHRGEKCFMCQSRLAWGLDEVGLAASRIHRLKWFPQCRDMSVPRFSSLEELRGFEFREADIGMGVVSSLVSQIRDTDFDLDAYRERIETNVRMAVNSYLNAEHFLDVVDPQVVYVFNGRFADQRPLIRAAAQRGVEFRCHERGGSLGRYEVYRNALPHDRDHVAELIEQAFEETGEVDQIARQWFETKRAGSEPMSFVSAQARGRLPSRLDPSKHNIVMFNSSEDEFFAIAGWDNHLFDDQNAAIAAIAQRYEAAAHVDVYLRLHPNLAGLDNLQLRQIEAIRRAYPGLAVIGAEADIDTYALMDACDIVVTFGSTMGVEATYWRKPSVLVGQAFYQGLACVYEPGTPEQLFDWLATPELEPCGIEGAIKYGYWAATHGRPYRRYEPTDAFTGTFDEAPMGYDLPGQIYIALKKSLHRGAHGRIYRWMRRHGAGLQRSGIYRILNFLRRKASLLAEGVRR